MNLIAINTSQNVNIDFALAGIGERILAFIIDGVIQLAYLFCVFYLFFKILGMTQYELGMDSWSFNALIIIISFPVYIYTLVLESVMEGQTIGKKLMKIKVVKIDGYQAGFGDFAMRWLFRLVDIWSNFGVVGVISAVVTDKNQRLGDIASGTAVISLKNKVTISHTILEELQEDYVPTFPQVILLNDNDMRIIKENYQRAMNSKDRVVITKLSNKIKETIKLDTKNDYTDSQFVNIIIKDYNFYTGKDI